jgi:hypothetical protein
MRAGPMLLKKGKNEPVQFFPRAPVEAGFPVIKRVTVTLRRLPVENWIGYLSPYSASEKICSTPRKTFFNSIGQEATNRASSGSVSAL